MAAPLASQWLGIDKAKAKLKGIPAAVRPELRAALLQGANEMSDMQKRLAPVDDGDLVRSLKVKDGAHELQVKIVAEAPHAHLVEHGTAPHPQGGIFAGTMHPGTAPQPFFRPPTRVLRPRVKSRVTRAANKAAKRVAGK